MIEILVFGVGTNQGGIETYYKKIWDNINRSEFHFNIIDMTGEGKRPCFYDDYCNTGVTFYKITPRNVSVKKNKEEIRNLFRNHHFDIFHFSVNTLSYIFPVEEALKNKVRIIVHSRNGGASNKILTRVLHKINKGKVKKLNIKRIAVSPMAGEWLFGESNFDVYYNGVNTEKFRYSAEARNRIRQEQNCSDKIVIGNVGAFLPAKNHRFMVDAFETLLKSAPNYVLWFIGDGPARSEIEQMAREKRLDESVKFWGLQKDVSELYSAMDLFWFPSLFEGFGNVVLEAECSGLPCLLSDCIPQDALITVNSGSFSLEKSKEEWARKIEEMTGKESENRENAYLNIERSEFSVTAEIVRVENLYRAVMRGML